MDRNEVRVELRDIEIFLALAEELHFGRTAERLHVSQARVSQAIKKQERRIGAPLFDRTSRRVRITPAGEHLYRELSAGYRQIMDGIEAVSAAARGTSGTLTLGAMGPQAWMIQKVVELFQTRYPAARIRHRDINPIDPLSLLRSGEIDLGLLWLPIREPGLTVGPVTHTSALMLMVADTHPFAGRESVCLEDFGDCTFISPKSAVPAYVEEVFQPSHTPAGRPIRRGPQVASWHDQLTAVSSGQAVAATVAEAARFYPWPNLVYVPVRDAPPCRWALVWRTANAGPLLLAFAQTVRDLDTTDAQE